MNESIDLSDEEFNALLKGDELLSEASPKQSKSAVSKPSAPSGGQKQPREQSSASLEEQLGELSEILQEPAEEAAAKKSKPKVQKVSFGEFDQPAAANERENTSNMDLLMDVPMSVTVELGRTTQKVKEVLSLNLGSIIELDRLSGEPVDLLVNGKVIARAEVVVIDENFGVRITEIIDPKERIEN